MSHVVRGRITDRGDAGIHGAHVLVSDRKTGRLLGEAATGVDGSFTTRVDELDTVSVRVLDARGELVSRKSMDPAEPVELTVPNAKAARFAPAHVALERIGGPILDRGRLGLVEVAVRRMTAGNPTLMTQYLDASLCPGPDILILDELVSQAWQVIDGDPRAAAQFRETLVAVGSRHPDPPNGDSPHRVELSEDFQIIHGGGTLAPRHRGGAASETPVFGGGLERVGIAAVDPISPVNHPCLVGPTRFLPVASAALRVATSLDDAQMLLSSLEAGLCGLGMVERLVGEAERYLEGGSGSGLTGMLDMLLGECGPDDGPIPRPGCNPVNPDDACAVERANCIQEMIDAWRRPMPDPYRIASIEPATGCPGDVIELTGENFGATGLVCFSKVGFGEICVPADSWSDDSITVTVPEGADDGWVRLDINAGSTVICRNTMPLKVEGNRVNFDGGSLTVLSFRINGDNADICLAPDQVATLSWVAAPADASVSVTVTRGSATLVDLDGQAASGTASFATPDVDEPRSGTAKIVATSACGTVTQELDFEINVLPTLAIDGMEITQGIQRFWRPGVVWNSLPTFADKDTIVRVYVTCDRNGFMSDECADVTGILRVGGTDLSPINGITPTSAAGDPFITARPAEDIDRTETDHTLNFRIPAALCNGTKTIQAFITGPPMCGTTPGATESLSWTWNVENALKVRHVRIRDNRPGGSGTRPSTAEAVFTVQRGFDLLPSPPTDIAAARTSTWNTTRPFDTLNGLSDLLADIEDEHNCSAWEWAWAWTGATDCPDDDHAIWVGITDTFNRGVAYRPGNTAMSAEYEIADGQASILRIKTAHEIAHNLSFMHVNRVCSGSIQGSMYNHPNNGNLVDVPFDPFWNEAIGSSVQDFMSYGCTRWTSGDSWTRLQPQI